MAARGRWESVVLAEEQRASESNGEQHSAKRSDRERPGGFEQIGTLTVEPYLIVDEVADIFRVHAKTIERWRRRDKLPCERLGGVIRYRLSDVLRWASARKEGI